MSAKAIIRMPGEGKQVMPEKVRDDEYLAEPQPE